MVATRKSLPVSEPDEAQTPASEEKKRKLNNALKKLEIDGHGPLKGEHKPSKRAEETYHYRGAVYEKTALTAPEWIEQQPSRYKKRSSSVAALEDEEHQQRAHAKRKKQKTTRAPTTGTKRPRSPSPAEDEDADQPSAKRPRRGEDKYTISYARPRNLQDFTPSGRKSKGRPRKRRSRSAEQELDRMRTSRLHDYAVVGGRETLSCIEHARRRAQAMGFEVRPLPEEALREPSPPPIERTVWADLVKLARVNSRIERVGRELEEARAVVAGLSGRGLKGYGGDALAAESPGPTLRGTGRLFASQAQKKSTNAKEPQHSLTPPPHPNTASPAPSSEVEIITTTSRHDSRQDSGRSLTPTHTTTALNLNLPTKARGGQTLRWSLPKNISEPGRAEEAITRGRLAGESKSSRRRRVKREMAIVRRWTKSADQPGEGEEEGEEEGEGEEDAEAGAGAEEVNEGQLDEEEEEGLQTPITAETPEGSSNGSGERRSSRVENERTKVCRQWAKEGVCWRGVRCTHRHGVDS